MTANKTLLATEGEHLVALARSTRATLSFEAAVAGGVPVLRVLRDALPHAGVRSIRGVLNGTTNYILTRMKAGAPFVAALAEAQARGFAEADPARDLDGRDAADKIAVLAWQTFGLPPDPAAIQTRGLLPDPDRLIRMAAALDGDVRLLGECFRTPQGIAVTVEPVILDRDSALARTAGEENTVEIATEHTGTIRLSGPGAGGAATASAILSDLRAAATTLPGTRVEGVLAASDTRKLRWALAATDRAFVRETAGRLHVPLSPGSASADAVAVTQPIDRVLAAAFARELELRGAAPLLVRVDDALSGS